MPVELGPDLLASLARACDRKELSRGGPARPRPPAARAGAVRPTALCARKVDQPRRIDPAVTNFVLDKVI